MSNSKKKQAQAQFDCIYEIVRRPKIRRIGNQFYWESDLK